MNRDILGVIEQYILPSSNEKEDIIVSLETIKNINLMSKNIPILEKKLYYINKYQKKSILLDAISGGMPGTHVYTYSSVDIPNEEEIREISILFEEENLNTKGQMRCRDEMPPVAVAWHNQLLSKELRFFLLDRLKDPNVKYNLNGGDITLLRDLKILKDPRISEYEEYLILFRDRLHSIS